MSNNNFTWVFDFDVDKLSLDKAINEVQKAKKIIEKNEMGFDDRAIKQAIQNVEKFERALKKAYNVNLNKLDIKKFINEMANAGLTLNKMRKSFAAVGVDGNRAFSSMEKSAKYVGLRIKETNKFVEEMSTTFKNTLKWNVASSAIHQVQGSVGRAIGYVKDLDESLNNIRVVTNYSAEDMRAYANYANEAAKALGKTTTEYTDASLIFFQQGKNRTEVEQLTRATLIGANITGEEVAQTAELLTASLNGFNLEANQAMTVMDKFAAVGASTGSDFDELAKGFSKVASMAHTAGVNVDQLNGMLATTATVTRESPESIGTSYKTILGRMAEVKAGKADEDGWTLGKVEAAFNKVKMSVLDINGHMREMGEVIEEVGPKWKYFNQETKMALSTAMAGNRQQNRLIALFNNWDMYMDAVKTSQEAEGAALQQNMIRMDSLTYKSKQLRAELEKMWSKMINSDQMKSVTEITTKLIEGINKFIDSAGGIAPLLTKLSLSFGALFSRQIAGGIANSISGVKELIGVFTNYSALKKNMTEQEKAYSNNELLIHRMLGAEKHEEYRILINTIETLNTKLVTERASLNNDIQANKLKVSNLELEIMATEQLQNQFDIAKKMLLAKQDGKEDRRAQKGTVKKILTQTGIDQSSLDMILPGDDVQDNQYVKISGVLERLEEVSGQESETRIKRLKVLKEQLARVNGEIDKLEDTNGVRQNAIDNINNSILKNEQVMKENFEEPAKKVQKSIMLVSAAFAAANVATGFISTLKSIKSEMTGIEKLKAGVTGVFQTFGSVLMSIPHPAAQAAGALVQVVSSIIPLIEIENDLTKAMKKNAQVIKSYREEMNKLQQGMKDTLALASDYKKFQEIIITNGNNPNGMSAEDQQAYYGMMEQIGQLYPDLIRYYDDHGRAIIDLGLNFDILLEKQREQIRVQNDMMVQNSQSFAFEYKARQKTIEQELYLTSIKAKQLEESRKKSIGNSDYESMKETQAELAEANESVRRLQNELNDVRMSINTNIVLPFMSANNQIKDLDNNTQGLLSTIWNYNSVSKAIYSQNNYEKAIKDLQRYTLDVADTLTLFSKKATEANSDMAKSFEKLQSLASSTQKAVIDSVMSMPLTVEQQVESLDRVMQRMIVNKEMFLAKPLRPEDLLPVDEKERKAHLSFLKDEADKLDALSQKIVDVTTKHGKLYDTIKSSGYSKEDLELFKQAGMDISKFNNSLNLDTQNGPANRQSGHSRSLQEDIRLAGKNIEMIQAMRDNLQQLADNAKSNYQEMDAAVRGHGEAYQDMMKQMGEAHTQQLLDMATTVEGHNMILEAYNGEQKAIGGLIDQYYEIETTLDRLYKSANGFETPINKMNQALKTMGTLLQDLPLAQLMKQMPELKDEIEDVIKNGNGASQSSIEQVYLALDEARIGMSAMFLALNKDNEEYFDRFRVVNDKQIDAVYTKTGIMADNYRTYAEYEEAVNEQLTNIAIDNSKVVTDKKASLLLEQTNDAIKSAREEIGGRMQLAKKAMQDEKTYAQGYKDLQKAKAQAAILAQLESEKKQIESNLRIVETMVTVLEESSWTLSKWFNVGKGRAYNDAMNEFNILKARLEGYKEEISNVTSGKMNFSTIDNINVDNDIKTNDWEYNVGTSNNSGKYKGITSPKEKSLPTTTVNTEGPGASKDGSKSKKDVKDMEFAKDVLHDTDNQLKELGRRLDELADKLKDVYGEERIEKLKEEKELLKQQQLVYGKQLDIIKEQVDIKRKALSSEGVKFDEQGRITNYNAIIESKVNKANSYTDPDKKSQEIEKVKKFMEDIKEYENFSLNVKVDKEKAIREIKNSIRAIELEVYESAIKEQLETFSKHKEAIEFINSMKTEFEDISEIYENTALELKSTEERFRAIQDYIKQVENDSTLSAKERKDMIEEYQEQLKNAAQDAQRLRGELQKINERVLKEGIELLDAHLSRYDAIDAKLQFASEMLKLIGRKDNYQEVSAIYAVQAKNLSGQIDALLKAKKSMVEYTSQLEEGTEAWKQANEQVEKMDTNIQNMTKNAIKLFQEEFKNNVSGLLDAFEKKLFGGMNLDDATDKWERLKREQEKYLTVQEKIINLGKMQTKIEEEIATTTNPEIKAKLQKFLDTELKTLKSKDQLTRYEVERAEKLYDITQKQIAIEEARNNKTLMRLVRDSSGNWSYQYVADVQKVEEAQRALSNSMQELNEYDKKHLIDVQEEILDIKKNFREKMQRILERALNGEYATEADYYYALEQAQREFNDEMAKLQIENSTITKNISESTLAAILDIYANNKGQLGILNADQEEALRKFGAQVGLEWEQIRKLLDSINGDNADSFKQQFVNAVGSNADILFNNLKTVFKDVSAEWDNNVLDLISGNTDFRLDLQNTLESIKTAWSLYEERVTEITAKTKTSVKDVTDGVKDLSKQTDNLGIATDDVVSKIENELVAVSGLIDTYKNLDLEYQNIITDAINYADKLANITARAQEAASACQFAQSKAEEAAAAQAKVSDGGAPIPTNAFPNPSVSSTPQPTPQAKTPRVGGMARVTDANSPAYVDSNGTPARPWNEQAKAAGVSATSPLYIVNMANGKVALGKNSGSAIAWVDMSRIAAMKTGGYTGEFGKMGKLGILHEKELILNESDTKNILETVKIQRGYTSIIKQLLNRGIGSILKPTNPEIRQHVTIEADFSGVKSSGEIEKAFDNLTNRAAQYAFSKK